MLGVGRHDEAFNNALRRMRQYNGCSAILITVTKVSERGCHHNVQLIKLKRVC
jgi:hypothetical protein